MKTRRIVTLLLAFVLVAGLLPATVFAAYANRLTLSDKIGKSYEIKDGIIKLSVPFEGYEGTELVDKSLDQSGNSREIRWTVEGDTGTLHIGFYELCHALWIDGGDELKEVVIELSGNTPMSST